MPYGTSAISKKDTWERSQIETLVGLFVLLGALAIVFLSLKAANLASFTLDSKYPLIARFDNRRRPEDARSGQRAPASPSVASSRYCSTTRTFRAW